MVMLQYIVVILHYMPRLPISTCCKESVVVRSAAARRGRPNRPPVMAESKALRRRLIRAFGSIGLRA